VIVGPALALEIQKVGVGAKHFLLQTGFQMMLNVLVYGLYQDKEPSN
jgi:hypothetical protein